MKIALIQGRIITDRPAENLDVLGNVLKQHEFGSVDLVVLPRLCLSGFLGPVSSTRPGLKEQHQKVFKDFLELSRKFPKLTLASSALIFAEDGQVGGEETFLVQGGQAHFGSGDGPGDGSSDLLKVGGNLVGLRLGEGGFSPEAREQSSVLISLYTHSYHGNPYYPPPSQVGKAWMVNVGAVGAYGPKIYEGSTWVFSPDGELKAWATGFEKAVIIFDTKNQNLPTVPLPKREHLEVLYEALLTGLREYINGSGVEQVLLGLSGGIDSALVAALAVDALGADKVLGVALPSEYNSAESLVLARELAKNLGIAFLTVPIDGIKDSFTRSFLFPPKGEEKSTQLANENIQARIRGVLLMYLANSQGRLLLSTTNKSEAAMGFSTLYGDTCGAIAPAGDIYKGQVYELSRWVNRVSERIPEGTITRAPSAELRPDQKDEDVLPPYPILDDILFRHLEGGRSGSQVVKEGGHSAMLVAWVLSTIKRSAFKRSQEPFCLTASTCPLAGLDW